MKIDGVDNEGVENDLVLMIVVLWVNVLVCRIKVECRGRAYAGRSSVEIMTIVRVNACA